MSIFTRHRPEPEPAPEERNYSDIVTNALVEAATNSLSETYVSALEIAAGQMSRAFASAGVSGPGAEAFDPWSLAQMGRSLVEEGEAVWYRLGRRLVRASNYELLPNGSYQFSQPTGVLQMTSERVFHARWNVDTASGRGMAPLTAARTLRDMSLRLEASLATEAQASVGYLLPVPADGQSGNIEDLKNDLKALNGRIAVIETAQSGWGEGRSAAPRRDFDLARLGPDFPDGNVNLYIAARDAVLACCGYPVQLVQSGDGTGQREAWRRYLHGTVAPAGRLITDAAARIDLGIDLDFDRLFASDIQGRARAFQSLVGGGMSIEQAAAASGLLETE